MNITDRKAEAAAPGIRLIAMDLDGTLLTDDKRFTDRNARAVCLAAELGIEPVYVTGRPLSGIFDELLAVLGTRYAICSNGAVTVDIHTGAVLRSAGLDRGLVSQIVRSVIEKGCIYCVIADGKGFSEEGSLRRQFDMFRGTPVELYLERTRRTVPDIYDLIDTAGVIENIWVMAEDGAQRDLIGQEARAAGDVRTVFTSPTDVEIGSPGADKGVALLHLAEMLGIAGDQIAAIGDNGNDLGMLSCAGIAAVMGNAWEGIKAHAQVIAGSNEEDGAAEFIEWLAAFRR